MDIELENKNLEVQTNAKEIKEFTKELEEDLNKAEVKVYQGYDYKAYTRENEEKLWNKKKELIANNIMNNNIDSSDKDKLYEISYKVKGGINVVEYDRTYENRISLTVSSEELPENFKKGMFCRKLNGKYVLDKETTEKVYNEMKAYEKELINEQSYILNKMRKEGDTYEITYLEDDEETWYTELTNLETGETFQDVDFPHEIYHLVGTGSQVKYENATYSVVEGKSVFDLYPDLTEENFCEIDNIYFTKDGNYNSLEELYKAMENNKNSNKEIISSIKEFTKSLVEKIGKLVKRFVEFVKEKIS